LLGSYP
jgi:alanine racemase